MDLSVVPYQKSEADHDEDMNGDILNSKQHPMFHQEPVVMNPDPRTKKLCGVNVKYRECMRNHAASIGGHANDGCGEFMPRGEDGTRDWLTCAACGCHRNFHRKESDDGSTTTAEVVKKQHQHQRYLLSSSPQPQPQQIIMYGSCVPACKNVMMSRAEFMTRVPHCDGVGEDDEQDRRSETPERGDVAGSVGPGGRSNKRFRTKFTQEQKERMLEFAEKIGWRIQRHDDMALDQFCSEVGVKRNVLKVWMHNNKNAHRRREEAPPPQPLQVASQPPPAPPQPVIGV